MKDLQNLDKLTIREILIALIGQEKAEILLRSIMQGINEGLQGEELNKLICENLCKLGINQTEVFLFLQVIPHVNPS